MESGFADNGASRDRSGDLLLAKRSYATRGLRRFSAQDDHAST
jgi:hypothetical protein